VTAEIAIMNRLAVVLAADSATTVTYWNKGTKTERYFKGANKLFQLSNGQPVGLMIYATASLHGVPWDIIVKEFRRCLGDDVLPKLSDYCDRFCAFIKGQMTLFPDALRKTSLVNNATQAAYQLVYKMQAREKKGEGRSDALKHVLEEAEADLAAATLPEWLTEDDKEAAVAAHAAAIERYVDDQKLIEGADANLKRRLASIAVGIALVHFKRFMGSSGIVIAGYGNDEFFPSFYSFRCFGFLDSHFLWMQTNEGHTSDDKPATIEPFATTSMINTFQMGISPDVFEQVTQATTNCLRTFSEELRSHIDFVGPLPDIEPLIKDASDKHTKEWFYPSLGTHYDPLAAVIGSLPVADMAALAKSLIELESLKERVPNRASR